jgi:hypothetical protein
MPAHLFEASWPNGSSELRQRCEDGKGCEPRCGTRLREACQAGDLDTRREGCFFSFTCWRALPLCVVPEQYRSKNPWCRADRHGPYRNSCPGGPGGWLVRRLTPIISPVTAPRDGRPQCDQPDGRSCCRYRQTRVTELHCPDVRSLLQWYLLTQVWDVVFKTRCKYVPVSSTAASVPPTVLKKTSRTWPHDGG